VRAIVHSFRFAGSSVEEELVQETMARVLVNLGAGAFRGESSLTTYAQRIARHVCLEQIRKRRVASGVDPAEVAGSDPASGPEASLIRAEEHRHNLALLASLSPACLDLFRLIFVEELTYAQAAERLGVSETAVKLRVYRCRQSIQSLRTESGVSEIPAVPSATWRHYGKGGK
jgi:RNA polymerase sigma-70 factor (ECF subfamily)